MKAVTAPLPPVRKSRISARLATAMFLAGLLAAVIALRSLPPAPIFSPRLGRATYWQSYESAYFATLRAYEQPIRDLLTDGYIPIVVFGDSTIRGTGALGEDVWTRQLEKRLQTVNSRVRVLNYAQNAGDLMGPFLYHHLQQKFPEARYIVQWHFSSTVGLRHPFHYWLTSEIALRDGNQNPAVAASFNSVPVTKMEERCAFAMAALNILTNYLDVGNWVRYLWLGRPYFSGNRRVYISALRDAAESDVPYTHFTPVEEEQAKQMRGYFHTHQDVRQKYVLSPLEDRKAYFLKLFPSEQRDHLQLITLDFNPYYAPHKDKTAMDAWPTMWRKLRTDMAQIPDLAWVAITGSSDDLEVDDYIDLGHLTVSGQRKLAEYVAAKLLAPGGWFDPAKPGSETPPAPLNAQWFETKNLKPYQLVTFQYMTPQPSKFFSSYGPGLDKTSYSAHPQTRLIFRVPPGHRHLQTTVWLNSDSYTNIPKDQATDGIQFEVAILGPGKKRTVVFTREIDPLNVLADREILPVDVAFEIATDTEIELFFGPGKNEQDTRDWALLGPLTIN